MSMQRFERRLSIVSFMIRTAGDDLQIWQWLEKLLQWLTVDGMSSEDTDVGIDRKYHVKILLWRREMDEYLNLIDNQWHHDAGYSQAGSKPIRRLRHLHTLPLTRNPPKGLPETLYDQRWLADADSDYQEVNLNIS